MYVGCGATSAHVLSPLKKVVELGVPVADKSAVTVTAPVAGALGVKSIKVPSVVVTEVTAPPPPAGTVQFPVPSKYFVASLLDPLGTHPSLVPPVYLV